MDTLINISTKSVDGLTKEQRGNLAYFNKYIRLQFNQLAQLANRNINYSPFNFIGHQRGRDYCIGTTNWVAIDIDHTDVSIDDRFVDLKDEDLIFIIASTSDPTNKYRYRILMLLDRDIDVDEYSRLIKGIQVNGLITDIDIGASAKASGFMYFYKDSYILSNFIGNKLVVDDYILEKQESAYIIYDDKATDLPADFIKEFDRFTRATPGNRSKRLMCAAYNMMDSGYNPKQIKKGVLTLNKRLLVPKSEQEVIRRVINPIVKDFR